MPGSSRRRPLPVEIDTRVRQHADTSPAEKAHVAENSWDRITRGRVIRRERIRENPTNPRTDYGDIESLAASIAARGVLLPLLVRPDLDRPGYYITIAGSRRLRAAEMVAHSDDPRARLHVAQLNCIITDSADRDAYADALLENMGRKDLSRAEMMLAVKRLQTEFGWSGAEIARRTGRNQSDIATLLRLADDDKLAPLVMDGQVAPSVANVIQRLPQPQRHQVIDGIRAGERPTADAVRARVREVRRRGGDATDVPQGKVVNSLPLAVAPADEVGSGRIERSGPLPPTDASRGWSVTPEHSAADQERGGTSPGAAAPAQSGQRLRPTLVTLNNLAREIAAFLDRHSADEYLRQELLTVAAARDRLNAFLAYHDL